MAKKCYIPGVTYPVLKSGNHWESQEFKKGEHNGEDLISRTPTTKASACSIIAIDDGTVSFVGYSKTRGYYVELKHQLGKSRYLHMKKDSIKVKLGEKVKRGQTLGMMGATGEGVTGTHLHLAIIINGNYVDPYPYLMGYYILNLKIGNYTLIENKYIRTSPEVKATNKVKYAKVDSDLKENFQKDKFGYARYKVGVTVHVNEIKKDKKGNYWGKTKNTWFCMFDKKGYQCMCDGE